MPEEPPSYFSPKLEVRPVAEKGGQGIFARAFIPAGELLLIESGVILNSRQVAAVGHTFSIQVEEDAFICPHHDHDPAYRINHSCNPNVGVVGQITFVALRDIAPGEEICYDYAMTDGVAYDEFTCACGQPTCRGRVTGNDWMRPELWERYGDHFSPYLLPRIRHLQAGEKRDHAQVS
ncbi:MAG: SET domain-containing protein [Anaerolineae bacterium]|nr:SET domain-containing protein [Anaerolineae bacterium]